MTKSKWPHHFHRLHFRIPLLIAIGFSGQLISFTILPFLLQGGLASVPVFAQSVQRLNREGDGATCISTDFAKG